MTDKPLTVDDYLAGLPEESADRMRSIRAALLAALPGAQEKIAYGMPTVVIDGHSVLHYSAWKKHIGAYPIPAGDADFQVRMAPYHDAKSTARFPFDEPLPLDLITQMARLNAQR